LNLSSGRFLLLLAAGVAVSMSYGVTLPAMPGIVGPMLQGSGSDTARHTGWLTAAYTMALFAFSPLWGALSDRINHRWVICIGLVGAGGSLWAVELARSIPMLYAARIGAGALAAAVIPAVLAYVVETTLPERRQRRFAWVASATALGFLLGPVAGHAAATLGVGASALQLVALVCAVSGIATIAVPLARTAVRPGAGSWQLSPTPDAMRSKRTSLLLTAAVVFSITVAEVGLTLIGGPVAVYFALCSSVMVGMQLFGYPVLERWLGERRLVLLSLRMMGTGVALLAWRQPWTPALAFVLAAGGLGVLIPALALRISAAAGARQGRAMGQQASAANLGQAGGAALTGMLFTVAAPAPFLVSALLLFIGAWLAWRSTASPDPLPGTIR
jgi:predicted MFS family arabinose efflux permease